MFRNGVTETEFFRKNSVSPYALHFLFMVDFRITYTPSMHRRHPPKSPRTSSSPQAGQEQGDFETALRVASKCPLISLIHHI